jgi:hypothetical protein
MYFRTLYQSKIQIFWDVTTCQLIVSGVSKERSDFRVKILLRMLALKIEANRSFETSENVYPKRQRKLQNDFYLEKHGYENFRCQFINYISY